MGQCVDRTNRVKYWPKWRFGTKTIRSAKTSSDWPRATAGPLASKLECILTGPSDHLPLGRWTQGQSSRQCAGIVVWSPLAQVWGPSPLSPQTRSPTCSPGEIASIFSGTHLIYILAIPCDFGGCWHMCTRDTVFPHHDVALKPKRP